MKEGLGIIIAEEAVDHLKQNTGIDLETENLTYLYTGKKSLYILFQDWDTMNKWAYGTS